MRELNSVHVLVPFLYWLRTRLETRTKLLQYVLMVVLPQIIWLTACTSSGSALLAFTFGFLMVMATYEFGYVANDWISERRETGSEKKRMYDKYKFSKYVWGTSAALKLAVIAGAGYALAETADGQTLATVTMLVTAVASVFTIHNSAPTPRRWLSFFALYVVRLSLPAVIAAEYGASSESLIQWLIYVAVNSAFHTYMYAAKKRLVHTELWIRKLESNSATQFVSGVVVAGVALLCALVGLDSESMTILALYCLATVVVWAGFRYRNESKKAKRRYHDVITHAHTDMSHDAVIKLEEYFRAVSESRRLTVFLTDHAEDFDEAQYMLLKKRCAEQGQASIIAGLEYTIARQHVLAHSLDTHHSLIGDTIEEQCAELASRSKSLIWAHPKVAVRKLLNPVYSQTLLNLAASMNGVEIYNYKNNATRRRIWEIRIVAFVVILLFGTRRLYIGLDAHQPGELRRWLADVHRPVAST